MLSENSIFLVCQPKDEREMGIDVLKVFWSMKWCKAGGGYCLLTCLMCTWTNLAHCSINIGPDVILVKGL